MKKFRFLEHTSDAKFQAYGRTLEEAFQNAATATASLMWDCGNVADKISHNIQLEGKDLKQLLVDFLEEILYLLDSRMFLLHSTENVQIKKKKNSYVLSAVFLGDDTPEKYNIYGNVKAITYNEMEVKTDAHFMVQVVVDI